MRNVDELSTCSGAHGKQLVDQLFMVPDNGGNANRTERLVYLYTGQAHEMPAANCIIAEWSTCNCAVSVVNRSP